MIRGWWLLGRFSMGIENRANMVLGVVRIGWLQTDAASENNAPFDMLCDERDHGHNMLSVVQASATAVYDTAQLLLLLNSAPSAAHLRTTQHNNNHSRAAFLSS